MTPYDMYLTKHGSLVGLATGALRLGANVATAPFMIQGLGQLGGWLARKGGLGGVARAAKGVERFGTRLAGGMHDFLNRGPALGSWNTRNWNTWQRLAGGMVGLDTHAGKGGLHYLTPQRAAVVGGSGLMLSDMFRPSGNPASAMPPPRADLTPSIAS